MNRFDIDPVERFTAGAVGEPGQRVFYVQAAAGGEPAVSFKLEKTQVAALAGYFAQLLADLATPDPGDEPVESELVEPVLAEWVVGTIGVAYDETKGTFLVRLDELVETDDDEDDDDEDDVDIQDDDEDRGSARLVLTRGQAHAFVIRSARLVSGGRPPCPLCGRPIDPEGHLCVKTNGHKH